MAARRFAQLPTDWERTPGRTHEAATSTYASAELPRGAIDSARQARFVGVLGALLQRYTQQDSISIDVIIRHASGLERRSAVDANLAGHTPLSAVISQAASSLNGARTTTESSSNIVVTFIDGAEPSQAAVDAYVAGSPKCDLHFILTPARGEAPLLVAYDSRLFRAETVDRLVGGLVALLRAAPADETPIEKLPMLGFDEARAITTAQENGTLVYPRVPVHRIFEDLAKKQPTAIAAQFQGRTLTYAELEAQSNRLAHHLIASGVGPDVAVGVCLRPSLEVLVSLLAIFKARGLYLPLDPTHPEALLARMLDEAKPRLVLTHSSLSALTCADRFPQFCFDTSWGLVESQLTTAPELDASLEDAAYLLYTSGTTGRPKGVLATQGNLAHYIHSAQQMYRFCADDVFVSLARYTFSISLFELVSPLCCGASLRILERDDVLSPERLERVLRDVTVLHAGPSLLGTLFRHLRTAPATTPRTFPRMRHASTGGDLVPPSTMEEMKRVFENAEIYVIYGCTEISCMGTTFPVPRDTQVTRSFVGKPFPDVAVRVVDPKGELVPFGVVGEICFAGNGIVRGYLHQPELTTQKFVAWGGRRFYQTGDVGRLHTDGNLEILGRRDFQVQLRGIRVELGAIENAIRDLGLAAQCAVVAKKIDVDDVRLVAFVVKPTDASVSAFRRALSNELPDYMLPQNVVVLDAMPLTVNGKLDRKRLQEMPWEPQTSARRAPPQNETEKIIAKVFCDVLEVKEVNVDEDFFDLGGHSLLAVIAIHEIEEALGVTFPPHILFERPTVRGLAAYAVGTLATESRAILLNEKCAAPPLFMLSGIHIYRELAKRLEGRYPAYGVFAGSELGTFESTSTNYSVRDLASDYVKIIRREQPSGPYRLLGYSFAGIVAYDVAQQLRDAGEEVRFLALVDAMLPEWTLGWKFRVSQLARLPSVSPRDLLAFMVGRVRKSLREPGSEFVRYGDDARVGPLERQRDQINYRAAAEYMAKMRPFAGNVTFVASGARLRNDPLKSPTGGWSPHIPSLKIETVAADHFRLLSDDPYVSQLAEILVRDLGELS